MRWESRPGNDTQARHVRGDTTLYVATTMATVPTMSLPTTSQSTQRATRNSTGAVTSVKVPMAPAQTTRG